MPASVHVPTRVRADAGALRERRGDLAEALGAAARRALAGSVEAVVEPRASFARVRLGTPEFTWLGAGLKGVPVSVRSEVENLVQDVLARAAGDAGLLAAGGRRPRPLEQLAERVDRRRYDAALAIYSLPSYAGGEVHVPVGGDAERIDSGEPQFDYVWRPLGRGSAWYSVFLDKIEEFGVNPQPGYLGAIFVVEWGTWGIGIVRYPDAEFAWGETFGDLKKPQYDPHADAWKWVDSDLPAASWHEISWVGDAGPGAAEKIREVLGKNVRETLKEKEPFWSQAEIDGAVERRLEAVVRDELATPGVASYVVLSGGGSDTLLRWETPFPSEFVGVRLLPLSYYEELTPGEGEGAGGAGAGAGAGAGGEAAGAVVRVPGAQPGPGLVFPSPPGSEQLELVCEPFLGEPRVSQLGADAEPMRRLVDAIASGLHIEPCDYVGTFLLNALEALAGRAASVAAWDPGVAEAMRATPAGDGNLGHVDFAPGPTLQTEFLRKLATVVPDLDRLNQWLTASYQEHGDLISGSRRGEPVSWLIQFHSELNRSADRKVGWLFVVTCQVLLLQLLASSRQEIGKRIGNAAFAQNFEQVLLPQLEIVHELQRAKELLDDAELIAVFAATNPAVLASAFADVRLGQAPPMPVVAKPGSWSEAAQAVVQALAPQPAAPAGPRSDVYELLRRRDGSWVVRDRNGRIWTAEALETAITLRRGTLESAEPLVKQLVDLPEVIDRFRGSGVSVPQELDALLREMLWHNEMTRLRIARNAMEAIRASSIVRSYPQQTVPGSGFALQGIHRLAHEQIGEFFRGSSWYGNGVHEVLDREVKRGEQLAFLEFGGLVLLSIVCPPAGVAAGVGVAALHYAEALEKEQLYGSLIDPELVLTHAEVEAELFATRLGLVLSLLPVASELAAETRAAFGAVARAGAAEAAGAAGARRAGLFSVEATVAHLTRVAERGFAATFAMELAKEYVTDKVAEMALEPVIAAVRKQAEADAPVGGIEGALARVLSNAERRRKAAEARAEARP